MTPREQFLHAASGTGIADTGKAVDGPYMSMAAAADIHAHLSTTAALPDERQGAEGSIRKEIRRAWFNGRETRGKPYDSEAVEAEWDRQVDAAPTRRQAMSDERAKDWPALPPGKHWPDYMKGDSVAAAALRESYARIAHSVAADQALTKEKELALSWCRSNGNPHITAPTPDESPSIVTGSDERAREGVDERNLEAQRQAIEACARIADHHAEPTDTPSDFNNAYELAAKRIARAIRRLSPNATLAASRPIDAEAGLVERLRERASGLTRMLGEPAWKPSRAHIETARNLMNEAATALATPKPPVIGTTSKDGADVQRSRSSSNQPDRRRSEDEFLSNEASSDKIDRLTGDGAGA